MHEFARLRHPPRRESSLRSRAAEPLAEAFVETIGNVAIKADIAASETALRADVDRVETTLKAEIGKTEAALRGEIAEGRTEVANVRAELKTDIGIVGLTVALVKLLG